MSQYKPCPKCGAETAEKMSFTWWGGIIGPKVLTHVKCGSCSAQYNGKTGKDNTTGIVIYTIVVVGVIGAFLIIGLAVLIMVMTTMQ